MGDTVKLVDICTPKQWKTIPTSALLDRGYPVYGANGIIGYYNKYNHENSVVAITCRGATCGSVHITVPNAYITGNAMCLDDLREDIEPYYLYYCLLHFDFQSVISGSAQPQITRQGLEKVLIPICSRDRQVSIANRLKKTENIIAKWKEELAKLDTLVKSRFIEMFGDPVTNPMGWEEHRLDEYIRFLTSGSRGWSKFFSDTGAIFITIKNVKNNLISLNNVQYVTPPDNAEAQRTKVREGDLLISITADLGRTGVVSKAIEEQGAYINQHLTCIRLKQDKINPGYVSYFMESDAGKRQFEAKNQAAVKAGLNFDAIKSLKLLVPPLELQNEYMSFVQQVDKSKLVLQKLLEKQELLRAALMQEYFG